MNVQEQIETYIATQPGSKRTDMKALHSTILRLMPRTRLWFNDGRNSDGKVVSNPNIGYGLYTIKYADGTTRDFYQIGLSANTSGISVYIMGLDNKEYLKQNFGDTIGKASVTGYCIKFKKVSDISIDILSAAIKYGSEATAKKIMRKITACEFMTLDGVIQNEENDGDGFKHGGWFFPFADEVTGAVVQERLAKPVDLLLGRKTFDGWETYWPTHSNFWPNVMTATKYVASNTRDSSEWQPSVFLSGDLAERVREPDIHVMGSADMLQTLFKADLVDALELMIIPVTLGTGKRLFQNGTIPAAFKVTNAQVAPKGILIVTYERDGDLRTGSPEIAEDDQ